LWIRKEIEDFWKETEGLWKEKKKLPLIALSIRGSEMILDRPRKRDC
jgi:hypothetical protein